MSKTLPPTRHVCYSHGSNNCAVVQTNNYTPLPPSVWLLQRGRWATRHATPTWCAQVRCLQQRQTTPLCDCCDRCGTLTARGSCPPQLLQQRGFRKRVAGWRRLGVGGMVNNVRVC